VLTLAVLVVSVGCLVLLVLAPASAAVVVPGFDEQERALYVDLFRLMLLTPILFAASTALGEVLVAERRFLSYALAPILYNAGIVAGTLLFHESLGIRAAAIGAVAGAALHLGIRVIGVLRASVPLRFRLDLRMPAVREFIRLMIPKMASAPIDQVTVLFFTAVASTLAAGSVSAISFARNFQSVPVSLIGVSIALAAFPGLSAAWAAGDRSGFAREVRRHGLTIGVVSTVAAIGLAIVGPTAIEVLLSGGKFDAGAVAVTAGVLAAFALSVPFDALGHLVARGLYATHNTLLPVAAAFAGFGVTVATTLALVGPTGVLAVPLGFAAGTATRTVLQSIALGWRIRRAAPPATRGDVAADAAA
jgi:putative peptidoglycan lipid II flippase